MVLVVEGGVVVIKEAVLQPESIWCNCIRGGVFLSWRAFPSWQQRQDRCSRKSTCCLKPMSNVGLPVICAQDCTLRAYILICFLYMNIILFISVFNTAEVVRKIQNSKVAGHKTKTMN